MWNQIDADIDAQFREARPLGSLDDDLELLDPIQLLLNGVDDTSSNRQITDWTVLLEAELDALEENAAQEEEHASSLPPSPPAASTADHTEWYPFKSKMELIGSLIMGHTHSMLSSARSLLSQDLSNPLVAKHIDFYPEMTNGLDIYKFSQSKKWLQDLLPAHRAPMCEVKGKHFYLFEPVQLLSAAVVIPLFFYQHDDQLFAKCLQIQRNHICQMPNKIKITIPASLEFQDPQLSTIPVNQFDCDYSEIRMDDSRKLMDSCDGVIYESSGSKEVVIPLPNPWRIKANGKIIRHVPITLYSDDTSGNTSKQFNKHISFYFTLSGLPPNISNQEYNCHFLASSNIASVLEQSKSIVEELNLMTTRGFHAYDVTISQEVLVTSLVLCFLADSPMHAEVTNTPNPGGSLHPCRMCTLKVKKKKFKRSPTYVQRFLNRDSMGIESRNPPRLWAETKMKTYHLFDTAMGVNLTSFLKKKTALGVADAINTRFITESRSDGSLKEKMESLDLNSPASLFNPFLNLEGFDGAQDCPVEILHAVLLGIVKYLARDDISKLKADQKLTLIGRLQSFSSVSLNIDSIKPQYLIQHIKSLVGRHFKIILQAAPFILLEFLTPERKDVWLALCNLCAFIFQTNIANMETYLETLKLHINQLLYYLIKSSAQWVNKPKLHILLHLPESIERLGNASLFSTEKFESYNGVLRQSSIHSNRQAPGRDLARSFDNYSNLKYLVSGGMLYEENSKNWENPTNEVTDIFTNNPDIQRSMGFNSAKVDPLPAVAFPQKLCLKVPKSEIASLPEAINQRDKLHQVLKIKLNAKEVLHKGVFVVIDRGDKNVVAAIDSIWESKGSSKPLYYLWVTGYTLLGVDNYYEMRKLSRTSQQALIPTRKVIGCINVQHNCHAGNCQVTTSRPARLERLDKNVKTVQVEHTDNDHFVINSASLRNSDLHHAISNLTFAPITPEQWVDGMATGCRVWSDMVEEPEDTDGLEGTSDSEDKNDEEDSCKE
ncbi:hypothetical protein PCANC_26024 [Puccinia coronata f. sp. avenae]|uniref:Uncharacterized protein n=1 Tax=Puccinia coronata f. sp. avenae TaxID=200324 RepID=A0A2N5RZY9_9BASI|nr:hypothetical protein PCANC_26024 [Puccinia coronata f. sp. avenae]